MTRSIITVNAFFATLWKSQIERDLIALSISDIEIKEFKPSYEAHGYSVMTLGFYTSRELAEQARDRLVTDPLTMKHSEP